MKVEKVLNPSFKMTAVLSQTHRPLDQTCPCWSSTPASNKLHIFQILLRIVHIHPRSLSLLSRQTELHCATPAEGEVNNKQTADSTMASEHCCPTCQLLTGSFVSEETKKILSLTRISVLFVTPMIRIGSMEYTLVYITRGQPSTPSRPTASHWCQYFLQCFSNIPIPYRMHWYEFQIAICFVRDRWDICV